MATLLPMTELNAVNTLLTAVGDTPVSTLSGQLPASVTLAQQFIDEVSRFEQTKGWHFNTEEEWPLVPDVNSKITLPGNCVRVDLPEELYGHKYNVVQRGPNLYDKKNHTYDFTETLKADLIVLLTFDELPEAARTYITIRAARVYGNRMISSDLLDKFSEKDEANALALMKQAETATGDFNIFSNPEMARTLLRNP